ncbi:unnamed protein product [Albugo candida]|uniref:Uncharacterized protein n=1 Tax=Albugo candida TaxID=65357 RepID=A0A024G724_9STRA|nr:unnamed protein product [Albugo candida]|eukprot:CCI42444.1 unnamed protein product [Albugo candida]
MTLERLLNKLPFSEGGKVFFGVAVGIGLCYLPVYKKNKKPGHDLFSSERPQEIYEKDIQNRREQLGIK